MKVVCLRAALFSLLLPAAGCGTNPNPNPSSTQVTQLSVQIIKQDAKTATYRLTNYSGQVLACYSVAVTVVQNNGESNEGQSSECDYAKGVLAPHASLQREANIEGNLANHSGVSGVDIKPVLAVFEDGSSEQRNDRDWHILMDSVKSENEGTRAVIAAIQQSPRDPLKAAAALEALRQKAEPHSPYDGELRRTIEFLKKSPSSDDLKVYLANEQKLYQQRKPYLRPPGAVP